MVLAAGLVSTGSVFTNVAGITGTYKPPSQPIVTDSSVGNNRSGNRGRLHTSDPPRPSKAGSFTRSEKLMLIWRVGFLGDLWAFVFCTIQIDLFSQGNLFALVLFVSPIHTFRRIIKSKSTERFSGLPYIYALLNCLICLWYGTPVVSQGLLPVVTVNSIGGIFQLIYIIIFIVNAERTKKVKMLGLLFSVFALFAAVAFASINFFEPPNRQLFVGYLSIISLISMFASPLFIINLVIRTKSVEYMPFYLSLATFLMSLSFFAYGLLMCDPFISVPNGIGTGLGIIQLVLYYYYSKTYGDDSREPLLESYA